MWVVCYVITVLLGFNLTHVLNKSMYNLIFLFWGIDGKQVCHSIPLLILLILCLNQYRKLMSLLRGCCSAACVLILGLFILPQRCNITDLKISWRFFFKEIEIVHLQAQVVHKRTMANTLHLLYSPKQLRSQKNPGRMSTFELYISQEAGIIIQNSRSA